MSANHPVVSAPVRGAYTRGLGAGAALRIAASALALLCALAPPDAAAETLGVPVPSRSRARTTGPDAGSLESGRGFRQTVRFYRKFFKRKGIDVQQRPTYAYRGVTIARFLARDPHAPWLAVHVFRHHGRTFIRIVPRDNRKPAHETP